MAYLSFNESFNSNLKFTTDDNSEESDEMLKKDLPLRYTWSIWEQIMQSNEKSAAYSDATHKVAAFSTVQAFWKLWNHMPQPSERLEQKRFELERMSAAVVQRQRAMEEAISANAREKSEVLSEARRHLAAMELTPDNWDEKTSGKAVFVKFLAPW